MLRRVATHPRAVSVRALASRQRLHTAPVCRALDEHDIISREDDMISIEGYSEYGFMVNGVQFRGGLFAFPGFALMWDAHEFEDLTWESLALIRTLQTPPELLVLGTGPSTRMLPTDVQRGLRELGIAFEFMSSKRAVATFNVLAMEDRYVAAAMLPPVNRAMRIEAELEGEA